MYKLMIVDDEEEVRKGIVKKIDWNRFHFDIAGEAENGREALDIMEEHIPDVVITDISMPFMDGLELAKSVKENYPTVKTVILTGFDDFKFAQQAIKYGVSDYILKPVLPKDINEILKKLKNEIDGEIAEREDRIKLQRHYAESLPILRDNFLTHIVTGRPSGEEIARKAESYGLRLMGEYFITAVIGIDANDPLADEDTELLRFAIRGAVKEILDKYEMGEAFFYADNLAVIAGFEKGEPVLIRNRMFTVLEEIRQTVEKYYRATVTAGVGTVSNTLANIRQSYLSACNALEYRLVLGGNRIIFVDDLEPEATGAVAFDEEKERMLVSAIKFGGEKEVSDAVKALFSDIGAVRSIKEYRIYFMEINAAILKLARVFLPDVPFESAMEKKIDDFGNMEEAMAWLTSHCMKLRLQIARKMTNTAQQLLEKAKDFIGRNYGDNELGIQKLADHLHISACYLSLIFKKEAGQTFLKYLIGVRLDAAKELLANPEVKIAEIAEKCGYPDVNYFSYFFKKNFGLSPREYRNTIGGKKES
jgi:two-component system response regulator YesN